MGNLARGKILHQVAKASVLSIREIVKRAGYKYPSFFVHVKKDDLPYEILARYGKVLGHDFRQEFPEMAGMYLDAGAGDEKWPSRSELEDELKKLNELYQDLLVEHYELLRKYTSLLEKQSGPSHDDTDSSQAN